MINVSGDPVIDTSAGSEGLVQPRGIGVESLTRGDITVLQALGDTSLGAWAPVSCDQHDGKGRWPPRERS